MERVLGADQDSRQADEARCQRLGDTLARRSAIEIIGFAERPSEALYRLDQEKFGLLPVANMTGRDGGPFPQSADGFLYTRCAVVAAGREVYESVFSDASKFAPFTATTYDGEWLLYVPRRAYELATGKQSLRLTRYNVESYSNPDGWPDLHS